MTLDINRPDLTVGVVGTGAMGRGIAQVTAQGGIKAILFDAAAGGAAKAKGGILETLKGLVAKGRLTDVDLAKTEANLAVAGKLEDLKACHVVVEAVFENLEVKQKLFCELEAVVAADCILASNTSSIRIASIARSLKQRDRVCGMHYFNPVPLMKLVEVIRAADTAQWVVDAMVALGKRQTRVPVVVGDTPGFLVNLGGTAIGTEGLRIYQEGRATVAAVDAVMRDSCGFRMGPFELMDLTGIDVNFPARKIIYEGFFHDRRMTPSPYHESLYAAGKLGRKTGGGWYAYDAKGAKVDPGADHLPSVPPATSAVVMDSHNEKLVQLVVAAGADTLAIDDGKSPILVAPIGKDATTTAIERNLDPKRTVAVDLTGDHHKRITIMTPPGADTQVRDAAAAMFAKAGTKVTLIKDSPGFIAQRMVSMIANLGCEMAMIGIASAADVDTAMTLGLNYPRGPLALADWLGVKDCHEILVQLQAITGDDRYRPSQWLRRRAMLGMSATTPE
ncbi:MAG: 3-hydroxyacyl-CoA dehydrogenase [Reyranella sp.]|uniref:3-hydroxyacyl-CoA dehydrogenase n=1 Tax=Reyranella sp. TaxID=1929291 RepID=UPI001AC515DE|nr:3-hydroxyacyl-CoA dehydrogenase [Reyranella sp.]MBN9087644.1 3-hydroxyacyl-CoA dehydrogenase [Reyranella sp.]